MHRKTNSIGTRHIDTTTAMANSAVTGSVHNPEHRLYQAQNENLWLAEADLGTFSMFSRTGAPTKDKIFFFIFCNMVTSQKYWNNDQGINETIFVWRVGVIDCHCVQCSLVIDTQPSGGGVTGRGKSAVHNAASPTDTWNESWLLVETLNRRKWWTKCSGWKMHDRNLKDQIVQDGRWRTRK